MVAAIIIIGTLHPIHDKHTHRAPLSEILSRGSKITPPSSVIVHSYPARTTCQIFTSLSVIFNIIQILIQLGTYDRYSRTDLDFEGLE